MMQQMRAATKWIFIILLVAFVGWLALDYSGLIGQRLGSPGDVAGRVNGDEIRYDLYLAAVRQAQEQRRLQGAPPLLTLEDQRRLEDQVFQDLVQQLLMQQEFERRGIRVSDAEIREAAMSLPPQEAFLNPEFQTDGQFDITKYQAFLSAADIGTLQLLESRYRAELPRMKLFQELTSGVYVSDAELWRLYRDEHDSVAIRLVHIQPEFQIADASVPLEENDIEAYYQANREDFRRPARAFLSYLQVSRTLNASDSAAALERAEEIRGELADGADFEALARAESGDTASRRDGGDLGWVRRGQMVSAFENALFNLRPGTLSDVVQTPFGYHIIQADEATPDSVRARHILIRFELAGDHLDAVEAAADSFDILAAEQEDLTLLDSVATRLGQEVRAAVVEEGERLRIDGRFVPDAALWAYGTRSSEISHVVEAPDAYYLFRLDSLAGSQIAPLEDVRPQVEAAARLEKKLEAARALAASILERVEAGAGLREAAEAEGATATDVAAFTRSNPAFEVFGAAPVIGAAFGTPVGDVSGLIETEAGIFLVAPTRRAEAERGRWEEQKSPQRAQITQLLQQRRLQDFLQALETTATVVDRRREIEERLQELANRTDLIPFGAGF